MDDFRDEVVTGGDENTDTATTTVADNNSRLQQSFWGETQTASPAPATATVETKKEEATVTPTPTPAPKEDEVEEEILDVPDWLKREFEVESVDIIKQEREELKKLRGQKIEFKNEDSKKYYDYAQEGKLEDLYNFLDKRMKVEKLSKAEISNKQIASDLVKFGIKNETPTLTDDEVDFLFNEKYAIPNKPSQRVDELDDEYSIRVGEWQTQVSNIEKRMMIEAKMAQPKLAQLQSELVLPDISGNQKPVEPTQEELDKFTKQVDDFIKTSDKTINEFKGFSATAKDKDVELQVSYELSKEQKKFLSDKITAFAKSGFRTDDIFFDRWVTPEKTVNVDQMTEDLSQMYFGKEASQKFATDAMGQKLDTYLKAKKNINFNDVNKGADFNPNPKSQVEQLQERFWGANV